MVLLPDPPSETAHAIYEFYEDNQKTYRSWGISVSSLGTECDRALWYAFRHVCAPERKEGRMLRLLETGEREEVRMLANLVHIGAVVSNEQARVEACGGHVRGKIDAEVEGLPEAPKTRHVVECKTHNAKNFKALSSGVRKGKYAHYVQLQIYMELRGLKRGLYMAHNKDTDELHCERIEHDPLFCAQILSRAQRIIDAPRPPAKAHEDPATKGAFACRFCQARPHCHEGWLPHKPNCRTCLHSTPVEGAQWHCSANGSVLERDQVAEGCPRHLYIPDLVPGEQVDCDEDANTITYLMSGGREWVDGAGAPLS